MRKLPKLDNVSVELLPYIEDNDLFILHRKLIKDRDVVTKLDEVEAKRWEEEICYVQRELQMRAISKNIHKAWFEDFRRTWDFLGEDYETWN
jgi:hypothetical protein